MAIPRVRYLGGVVAVLALAGCALEPTGSISTTPGATASAATPTASTAASAATGLTWLYGELGYRTSVLHVPLDYADPLGEQIPISLGRRVATDPANRIGTLVYLPGGPGDDGVEALRTAADVLFTDEVRERFDIVAFDARGNPANALGPTIRCPLDEGPRNIPGDPRAAAGLDTALMAASELLAEACVLGSGTILPLVGTSNVIADIDRLREALGEEQLSFVGISYGTLTGLRYAERYPEHVRALILDAPVDPALNDVDSARDSLTTLQRLFDEFLVSCATDDTCAFNADGQPRVAFDNLVADLAAGSVADVAAADLWAVLYFGLREPDELDDWLAAIRDGDMSVMSAILEVVEDPNRAGYASAMGCLDWEYPRSADGVDGLIDELRPSAPDFAWHAAEVLSCIPWPLSPEQPAAPVTAAGAPPILVIGSTDDAATPYPWAVSVADALEGGVLVTRDGHGHGSTSLDNACIDAITDAYLIDLTVPAPGTVCS
jgi:pimeloyl-ACP methyl ester carboxylesterase